MRRVVFVGVVALATLFGAASPASAHADLDSSEPAPSAVLETSPTEIFLDFSEPVSPADDAIELFDQNGDAVSLGPVSRSADDQSIVTATVDDELDDGLYVVAWRIVSADGHVAQGAFTFQVGVDAPVVDTGDLLGDVLSSREAAGGLSTALAVARSLVYLALAVALGGAIALGAGRVSGRVWKWLVAANMVATFGTLAHYSLQAAYTTGGTWGSIFDPDRWSTVLDTRLGSALVIRLVLLASLALLFAVVSPTPEDAPDETPDETSDETSDESPAWRERLSTSWWRSSTALVGAGIVLTLSASGHPSASELAGVAVAVDAVHLAAVVTWFGVLVAMVIDRLPVDGVRWFSRLATIAVPIAVVTGGWQTWHLGGGLANLGESTWGRSLIVKGVLAVVLVSFGFVAREIVWGAGREASTSALRRLMGIEIAVATAVFGLTANLVDHPPRAAASPVVFEASLAQGSILADVTVTPGRVGNNDIHLTIAPPGGSLDRISSVTMRMTFPDSSLPPVDVVVSEDGPNHFVGRVALLSPGTWTLEILVQPDPSTSVRLTTEVPIAD